MTTSRPRTDRPAPIARAAITVAPIARAAITVAPIARAAITVALIALVGHAGRAEAEPPPVTPAPITAASIAVEQALAPAMLARLAGHQARLVAGRLVIDDIAGEGRPWVGVIERHGAELWLRTDDGALRLAGPLARPRIAGPGYRAWAIGTITPGSPPALRLRRLGILARPSR